MASEPRYISPVAVPDGERRPWRAPIIRSSSPAKMMASANAPCRRCRAALGRGDRRQALSSSSVTRCDDRLGIGVGLEHVALGGRARRAARWKFSMMPLCTTATLVVHVRMRVALRRAAVRRPARVADAGVALQRLLGEPQLQILELALGAPALEMAVLDGGDAALNHSRDIRAAAARRRDRWRPPSVPSMPTMPHMRFRIPLSLTPLRYC